MGRKSQRDRNAVSGKINMTQFLYRLFGPLSPPSDLKTEFRLSLLLSLPGNLILVWGGVRNEIHDT